MVQKTINGAALPPTEGSLLASIQGAHRGVPPKELAYEAPRDVHLRPRVGTSQQHKNHFKYVLCTTVSTPREYAHSTHGLC